MLAEHVATCEMILLVNVTLDIVQRIILVVLLFIIVRCLTVFGELPGHVVRLLDVLLAHTILLLLVSDTKLFSIGAIGLNQLSRVFRCNCDSLVQQKALWGPVEARDKYFERLTRCDLVSTCVGEVYMVTKPLLEMCYNYLGFLFTRNRRECLQHGLDGN